MIVQELAPLGSVLDRLRKECKLTSVALIFEWTKQICYGMEFLESKRYVVSTLYGERFAVDGAENDHCTSLSRSLLYTDRKEPFIE